MPLLTNVPPFILIVRLSVVASVTLVATVMAVELVLLVMTVAAPPLRFSLLTLVGLGGLPVCCRVRKPVPVGAMAMVPPEPVLMVAAAPDTVSRLIIRLALPAVPEFTEMALAPLLASRVAPLLKFNVGALATS